MALAIKSIPALTGEEASRFVEDADRSFAEAGSVDFSNEIEMALAILKKAKFIVEP